LGYGKKRILGKETELKKLNDCDVKNNFLEKNKIY
jgi:hypothetical protein